MKRFALALAFAACVTHQRVDAPMLASCDGPIAFYPPVGFEEDDIVALTDDMGVWNAVTRADHRLTWCEYGHLRIFPLPPMRADLAGQHVDYGVIFIRPGAPVGPVGLHELGHAIGLRHIAVPGAVMCSGELDTGPVDMNCGEAHGLAPADLEECRRVGACP